MNKRLMTTGIALALGVVWTAGPALAQQTTGEKIEDKAHKAGDKMERAADKTGEKAHRAADKAEAKTEQAKDKTESAWDKTKDKTREVKDKVKANTTDKMQHTTDRMNAKTEKADVMAMQQALRDKGYNPGRIDGVMGPRTSAALRDYQRKEGLQATGRRDDETAMKLGLRTSLRDKETVTPSASPSSPAMSSPQPTPSTPVGASTAPPATPEDRTAPPQKRNAP